MKKGNEIFIEVKTTNRNSDEPFYLTATEKEFCEKNSEKFILVRLYNFSYVRKSAQHFIISGKNLMGLTMTPTTYEMSK